MSPEKQRIKIAKACGWTEVDWYEDNQGPPILHGYPPPQIVADAAGDWDVQKEEYTKHVPNFLNDLNAMFDAFKHLGRHWEIAQVGDGYVCRVQFGPRNKDVATAGLELCPTMAEAFLRTLNLWEDAE